MRRVGRVIRCDVVALFFLFFILFLVLDSGLVGLVGWLLSWFFFLEGGGGFWVVWVRAYFLLQTMVFFVRVYFYLHSSMRAWISSFVSIELCTLGV